MMVSPDPITVKEIVVFPVKACQGISVKQAKVTSTGFEYDRTWCVIDLEGTHVPKMEAISGRRIPSLATIQPSFEKDGQILCLKAPGMPPLKLPTSPQEYESLPVVKVESAGAAGATTWKLAAMDCALHKEGSNWISNYLNSLSNKNVESDPDRLVNGKTKKGMFALVRSLHDLVHLGDYPPIFPVIERSKTEPRYKERFQGNYRRLSDFAPFLLTSQASARALAGYCQAKEYPVGSFRGNIIVDGPTLEAWEEESWYTLTIVGSNNNDDNELSLHTIKACPRCTVPTRNQTTGEFLFESEPMKLWNVLKKTFPRKFSDPEWGLWAGAFMGVYMGHHAVEGCTVIVGDQVVPTKRVPWDQHLREHRTKVIVTGSIAVAILMATAYQVLFY